MTHDEIIEMLGAYALDAVEADEREAVEAHLETCARCRAEVQEHREVASLLAHAGGDAPEGVWDRIAESLEEAPPDLRLVASPLPAAPAGAPPAAARPLGRGENRWHWAVPAAAAAAVALVVGALAVEIRQQDDRIEDLQVALEDPLEAAFATAVADPGSRIIELTSADGETVVRGAVTPDGMGYLQAATLPDLGADETYQLWGAAGDELVSLGVLGGQPRIVSFPAQPYELFAITTEVSAGVVASQNDPVVAGTTT